MRIGTGYDVHKLTENRKLILGGVEIPYEKGLLGHSDADVLIHAIMDAILGAAALGDIGKHFPDSDDAYKGISSVLLLKKVAALKNTSTTNSNYQILMSPPIMNTYQKLLIRQKKTSKLSVGHNNPQSLLKQTVLKSPQ